MILVVEVEVFGRYAMNARYFYVTGAVFHLSHG